MKEARDRTIVHTKADRINRILNSIVKED